MNKYQYRLTTADGLTVESSSPYVSRRQELAVTGGPCDEAAARRICDAFRMTFVALAVKDGGTCIAADADEKTSCFFWAGGCGH